MGHGTVADEIKGRTPHGGRAPGRDPRDRGGRRALPLLPRRLRALHGARDLDGDPGRAGLGHRAGVRRVHAVPRRRATTPRARPSARTAGCDRCLDWHHEHGPDGQLVYGIVQGGVYEDLRLESAQAVAASECDGIAIGGSLGADKAQMYEVVDWTTAALPEDRPRHLLGIGEIDDLVRGVELGIDTFDCAMPTRLGPPRHGARARPRAPLARRPQPGALEGLRRAAHGGLPVPGLRAGPHPRLPALPGPRPRADRRCACFTLHNLAFVERVMAGCATRSARGRWRRRLPPCARARRHSRPIAPWRVAARLSDERGVCRA